jgi:glycerophosphoryl diester phosphodiesterase
VLAPENTIAAFDSGLAAGAHGLELDVHLSADGVVVVHHDPTLERTTNLTGRIASRTADELARADAGYFFRRVQTAFAPPALRRVSPKLASESDERRRKNPPYARDTMHPPAPRDVGRVLSDPAGVDMAAEFPFRGCGINIPTLAAVLARYRHVPIVVELKVNNRELARAVVKDVRQADAIDSVCLGSFGLRVLREARRLEPRLATSAAREEVRWALYRSWCRLPVTRAAYQGYQVPEWSGRTRVVSPRFVEHAHAAGLPVQVWTVDTEADAGRLLQWGVDALTTDRPDIIVPFVGAHVSARG